MSSTFITTIVVALFGATGAIVAGYFQWQDSKESELKAQAAQDSLKAHVDKANTEMRELTEGHHTELLDETKRHQAELLAEHKKVEDLQALIIEITSKNAGENALTGTLTLSLEDLQPNDEITRRFGKGGITAGNLVKHFTDWESPPKFITIEGNDPIKVTVENKKLIINLVWYDLEGNWIAQIENNNWRRNPNYTGKFNYDSHGFEIIDNLGNIALNVDFVSKNEVILNGYYYLPGSGPVLAGGSKRSFVGNAGTHNPIEYSQKLKEIEIPQLFEYTGENWLKKRRKQKK